MLHMLDDPITLLAMTRAKAVSIESPIFVSTWNRSIP